MENLWQQNASICVLLGIYRRNLIKPRKEFLISKFFSGFLGVFFAVLNDYMRLRK